METKEIISTLMIFAMFLFFGFISLFTLPAATIIVFLAVVLLFVYTQIKLAPSLRKQLSLITLLSLASVYTIYSSTGSFAHTLKNYITLSENSISHSAFFFNNAHVLLISISIIPIIFWLIVCLYTGIQYVRKAIEPTEISLLDKRMGKLTHYTVIFLLIMQTIFGFGQVLTISTNWGLLSALIFGIAAMLAIALMITRIILIVKQIKDKELKTISIINILWLPMASILTTLIMLPFSSFLIREWSTFRFLTTGSMFFIYATLVIINVIHLIRKMKYKETTQINSVQVN